MVGIFIALVGLFSMMGYVSKVTYEKTGCDFAGTPDACTYDLWSWTGVFGHIGFAMFVFEGNAAVTNVRAETKNTHRYHCILTSAITLMLSLYSVFALIAYAAYRSTI